MKKLRGVVIAAGAALIASGCAVGPNYKRPAFDAAATIAAVVAPTIGACTSGRRRPKRSEKGVENERADMANPSMTMRESAL